MHSDDTIAAISTPPGRGGIGVVRLSGPQSLAMAMPLLKLATPLEANRTRFTHLVDPDTGQVLDQAVVTYYQAPNSYTTEDTLEIAAHGSPVLLHHVLALLVAQGARLAAPGEFTQRAFLAGRLDLAEAEAVNDLIHASTLEQARVAAAQLGGSLALALRPVKNSLVDLIAALEAGVDFAEDDIDLLPAAQIAARLTEVTDELTGLAGTYAYGRVLREGFSLALVGRPNAGKSSLFNRLLGHERAIVTAHPGTTRDPIAQAFSLAGIPVELIDTAGLREAPDGPQGEVEAHGIVRTRATIAEADVVLYVLDATVPADEEDARTLALLAGRPHVVVWNKIDLAAGPLDGGYRVSALTGEGLEALTKAVVGLLATSPPGADTAVITNLRQHTALATALESLRAAKGAIDLPHELLLLDLHAALEALDALTGATTPDDILGVIFSSFCIGK